jgi:hypothetical protein
MRDAPSTVGFPAMSDVSQGPGWWLASDGKWYSPERHPEVLGATSGSPLPLMSENPWERSQSGNLGHTPTVPTVLPEEAAYKEARPRRIRPAAIVIGVALALAALSVGAPIAGHIVGTLSRRHPTVSATDQITIPTSPPATLLGQPANPLGLQENTAWRQATDKAVAGSKAAFGSVYGHYPPTGSTTQTFIVIAEESNGAVLDIPRQLQQSTSNAEASLGNVPGSHIDTLPVQTSVLDGQVECVGVTSAQGDGFGECIWADSYVVVAVGTFTSDLPTVNSMLRQVVTELHSGTASG